MSFVKSGLFFPSDVNFTVKDLSKRNLPERVLMVSPDFFDVVDVKNIHMEGQKGKIDRQLAMNQWLSLKDAYQELKKEGLLSEIIVLPGAENCEDMVFAANQSFPWLNEKGEKIVVISKMRHPSRQKEVPYFEKFYLEQGYKLIHLRKTNMFEGMGDAIPMPGRNLIFGGFGHRTEISAYQEISEALEVPVVALNLINEKFYHLDTCFIPLSEEEVMLYPGAFLEDDLKCLKRLFKQIIVIPETEAATNFALNAHIINGKEKKAAILQKGSPVTYSILKNKGYTIIETDTSEYMKSGGSVFCMKMMVY